MVENEDQNSLEQEEQSAPVNAQYSRQRERLQKQKEKGKRNSMQAMAIGGATLFFLAVGLLGLSNMHLSGPAHESHSSTTGDDDGSKNTESLFKDITLPGEWKVNLEEMNLLAKLLNGLLGLTAVAGAGLFIYAHTTRRMYLEFDKIGMLISDSGKRGEGNARFVPWGCLEAVEIIYPDGKGLNLPDLEEGIDDQLEKMRAEGGMIQKTKECTVALYLCDGSVKKLRWRDLIACTEPGPFINALKTWAPDASQSCRFPGDAGKVDSATYTQLWFKYYSTSSERKRLTQLVEGDTLQDGKLEVMGQIGGGGQGTAYLAVDNNPAVNQPSEVVLKEYILPVHRGKVVLEQTTEKLRKEAEILAQINHPNIVRMLGQFEEDHRGYIVMEYVVGKSLKDLVSQEGPQPEEAVRELASQICEVLAYLHGMHPPIIHRDLTPDNLILQHDGLVKLVDFNVAHQLESAATATVVGKHCYIPPEQFRGKPTQQSDIYAFGCTLHYLLTGQEPEPITPSHPRAFNPAVSEELDLLIAQCTALDATKRFSSAEQLRNALQQIGSGTKIKINDKLTAPS